MHSFRIAILLLLCFSLHAQITPEIYSWKLNQGEIGAYYVSGNSTPVSNGIEANVQQVRYSTANVYVNSTGIPSYPTGPFLDANPSRAGEQAYLFRIPRSPQENNGAKTATRLGRIGVLVNGVPIFNALDAMSYNNLGIWHRNAVVMENDGFDCSKGHPAPNMQGGIAEGFYHHHQNPASFIHSSDPPSTVCDLYPASGLYVPDSTQHSPIIGYAFDGFPVYGAYGYADPNDAHSAIKRMRSTYAKRNITDRTTLPDGTILNAGEYGPALSVNFPPGSFIEDYELVQGSGDLDASNGRFCITPEYPAGTYAYFATMDADGNSEYPYLIGPSYYGVVANDNFSAGVAGGTNVTVTGVVTIWDGSIPTSIEAPLQKQNGVVYPNPAEDFIMLQFDGERSGGRFVIYNAVGKVVRAGVLNENQIEVASLSKGVYFVVIEHDATSGRYAFVKR